MNTEWYYNRDGEQVVVAGAALATVAWVLARETEPVEVSLDQSDPGWQW